MTAKLIGLGVKNYAKDRFNLFDAVIVIISLIDFTLTLTIDTNASADGIMSALRALRLLRVVKLARHWKAFQDILKTMIEAVVDISNFTVLLLLFIYIFALLGMELFAFSVIIDSEGNEIFGKDNIMAIYESGQEMQWPRENFNNVFSSLITVFIVIVAEDWNQVMYRYVRALDADGSGGRTTALLYFIVLFIVGNTVLLALFTALLLKSQDSDVESIEEETARKEKEKIKK